MKSNKNFFIPILLIVVLCLINTHKSAEVEKIVSKKTSFLKNISDKTLKSNTDIKVLNTVELQTSTEIQKPLVANHNLQDKSDEENYELERANAMAEFIF